MITNTCQVLFNARIKIWLRSWTVFPLLSGGYHTVFISIAVQTFLNINQLWTPADAPSTMLQESISLQPKLICCATYADHEDRSEMSPLINNSKQILTMDVLKGHFPVQVTLSVSNWAQLLMAEIANCLSRH